MSVEVIESLKRAILEYDRELAVSSAKKAVEQKLNLLQAVDAMTAAIRQVGDAYNKGELWLPDLVCASDAMSSAMVIIDEEIKKTGWKREKVDVAVVGTVYGDIHSIGKTMLAVLLTADGFEVHDLGVNVSPEKLVEAVKEYSADLLCMSALLTSTAPEQKQTIEVLKENGLRDKVVVLVGGAPITQEFADSIGADGYHPTAPGGIKLARQLLGRQLPGS